MASLELVKREDRAEVEVERLVRLARTGDRDALQAIYRAHAGHVRALLARLVGVSGELDDLLQDTFITAFRSLHQLREPAALGAWLRAVAVGEARHHLRSKARRGWLTFMAPEVLPDPPMMPAAADGDREAARAAQEIVRALDIDERLAFSLRFVEGMKLEEAAAACGVSLATFKRTLARAEHAFHARAREFPALDRFLSTPHEDAGGQR